jgi:streptomycin 3"-adenylyltransferase
MPQDGNPKYLEQARVATETMRSLFQDDLIAVYLHGSAASGRLRPQSDIDLIAVLDRPMNESQRKCLLSALLRISGRHPAPPDAPRCVEVMVFLTANLSAPDFPARAEFIYGEWLRDIFEAGDPPMPVSDPENTLVLAQARQEAQPLFGPDLAELLPEIPCRHVRRAMRNALPALLAGLHGDERNVLLTLARMWRTASAGEFVAKDAAAKWAAPRMPDQEADMLNLACEAYLGNAEDDWKDRQAAVRQTASFLHRQVSMLL